MVKLSDENCWVLSEKKEKCLPIQGEGQESVNRADAAMKNHIQTDHRKELSRFMQPIQAKRTAEKKVQDEIRKAREEAEMRAKEEKLKAKERKKMELEAEKEMKKARRAKLRQDRRKEKNKQRREQAKEKREQDKSGGEK